MRELTDELERLRAANTGTISHLSLTEQGCSEPDGLLAINDSPKIPLEPTSPLPLTVQTPYEDFSSPQEILPALYPQTLGNISLSPVQITRFFQA